MWDKKLAIEYLDAHIRSRSSGRCAEYVRKAVEAGGLELIRKASAKDYDYTDCIRDRHTAS